MAMPPATKRFASHDLRPRPSSVAGAGREDDIPGIPVYQQSRGDGVIHCTVYTNMRGDFTCRTFYTIPGEGTEIQGIFMIFLRKHMEI